MGQCVAEIMKRGFRIVTSGTGEVALEPCIVVDAGGEPFKVLTDEGTVPALVVGQTTRVADLAADARLTRSIVRGAVGLVVVDDGEVVGFVSRREATRALYLHSSLRSTDGGSDPLLYGGARVVSGAVRVRCKTCGAINSYNYYLPGEAETCVGGHRLDADLDDPGSG